MGIYVWTFAEIITLRAIALKLEDGDAHVGKVLRRDHNATSYSTETSAADASRSFSDLQRS